MDVIDLAILRSQKSTGKFSAENSTAGQVPTSNGDGTWDWKEQSGGTTTKKREFGKVRIAYGGYNSGCATIEEDARILAKYSVVVGGGPLHTLTSIASESDARARERAIVQRAKEINPDIRFFWYIGVASYRGGDILSENGVWDENSTDVPIMENQDIICNIHGALNVGGDFKGTNPETGLWEITGGIRFDGIFWDEFDMDSTEGCYNQGYNNFTGERYWSTQAEKNKFLIEYVHSLGLLNFTNGWNSQGIEFMNENELFCLESNETRYDQGSEQNDTAHWMNEATSSRLYRYYSSEQYKTRKCRAVALSYIPPAHSQEERERILTWCVFNTLAQGGHYVAVNGAPADWEFPELVDLFRIDEGQEYNLIKKKDGVYSIKANGHTLTTYRTAAGQTAVNMSTLNKVYVEIDGIPFQNAYAHLPEHIYNSTKKINTMEAKIEETALALESKTYASPYQKLMIDDWQVSTTFDDYTDLFGGTEKYTISNSSFKNYTCEYLADEDRVNYAFTSQGQNGGAGLAWVVKNLQPGHTYEIGCLEVTGAVPSAIHTIVTVGSNWVYNNWQYTGSYSQSSIDETRQCIVRYTVVEEEPIDLVLTLRTVNQVCGNANGLYTISAKGVYCVDVNELDEDISKTWYTNMTDTVKRVTQYADNASYIEVTKNEEEDSVLLEYKYHGLTNGKIEYAIAGVKAGHTYEIGFEELTGRVIGQVQILVKLPDRTLVNMYQYNANTYKASELDPKRKCIIRYTLPDTYSDNETFTVTFTTVSKAGGNGTTFYNIYLKGLYVYDLAETDELTIRGKTPSKTTLAICRVTEDMLAKDEKLVRNALYVSDNGRAFITNINGLRTNIVDAVYFGAVEAGYGGTPEEFGARLAALIGESNMSTQN